VGLGAAAAAVVGVLLWGGQGSLAMWTSQASLSGGAVTGGSLTLTQPACTWQLTRTGGTISGVPSPNPTVYTGQLLQPNDVVIGTCTTTVSAVGTRVSWHVAGRLTRQPTAPLAVLQAPAPDTASSGTFGAGTRTVTVTVTLGIDPLDQSNTAVSGAWNADLLQIRAIQDPS